jgi:hypothetical protein
VFLPPYSWLKGLMGLFGMPAPEDYQHTLSADRRPVPRDSDFVLTFPGTALWWKLLETKFLPARKRGFILLDSLWHSCVTEYGESLVFHKLSNVAN